MASYFALEVFTHDLVLAHGYSFSPGEQHAGSQQADSTAVAALAYQFLDYPLLMTYAESSSRTPVRSSAAPDSTGQTVLFHSGKSCVLQADSRSLAQVLEQEPLYVSLLDTSALPKPHLLASGSTPLLISPPAPLPQHAPGSGLPHAAVRSIPLYTTAGELAGRARISCRLTDYGSRPPPAAQPASAAALLASPRWWHQPADPAPHVRPAPTGRPGTAPPVQAQPAASYLVAGGQGQSVSQLGSSLPGPYGPPALYFQNKPGAMLQQQPQQLQQHHQQAFIGLPAHYTQQLHQAGEQGLQAPGPHHTGPMPGAYPQPQQAWAHAPDHAQQPRLDTRTGRPAAYHSTAPASAATAAAAQHRAGTLQGSGSLGLGGAAYTGHQHPAAEWATHSHSSSMDEFAWAEAAAHAGTHLPRHAGAHSQVDSLPEDWEPVEQQAATTTAAAAAHVTPARRKAGAGTADKVGSTAPGHASLPLLRALLQSSQARAMHRAAAYHASRAAGPHTAPLSLGSGLPLQKPRRVAARKPAQAGTTAVPNGRPAVMRGLARTQPPAAALQHQTQPTAGQQQRAMHHTAPYAVAGPRTQGRGMHETAGKLGAKSQAWGSLGRAPPAGSRRLVHQASLGPGTESTWGIRAAWPEEDASMLARDGCMPACPHCMQPCAPMGAGAQGMAGAAEGLAHQASMPQPGVGGTWHASGGSQCPPDAGTWRSMMDGGLVGRHMFSQGVSQGPHPAEGAFHMSSVLMWEMMNLVCMRNALSAAVGAMHNSMAGMASQVVSSAFAPSLTMQQQVATAVAAALQAQTGGAGATTLGAGGVCWQPGASMLAPMGTGVMPSTQPSMQLPVPAAAGAGGAAPPWTSCMGTSPQLQAQQSQQQQDQHLYATAPAALQQPLSHMVSPQLQHLQQLHRLAGVTSEPVPVSPKAAARPKSAAAPRPSRSPAAESVSSGDNSRQQRPTAGSKRQVPLPSGAGARPGSGGSRGSHSGSSVRTEPMPSDSYTADFSADERPHDVKQGGWVQAHSRPASSGRHMKQQADSPHTSSVHSYEQDFEDVQASPRTEAGRKPPAGMQQASSRPAQAAGSPAHRSSRSPEDVSEEEGAHTGQASSSKGATGPPRKVTRINSATTVNTAMLLASSSDDSRSRSSSHSSSRSSSQPPAAVTIKPTSTARPLPSPGPSRPATQPSPALSRPATQPSLPGYAKSIKSVKSRKTEVGTSVSSSQSGSISTGSGSGGTASSDGALPITSPSLKNKHVGFIGTPGSHGSGRTSQHSSGSSSGGKPLASKRSEAMSEVSFFSSVASSFDEDEDDEDEHTRSEELDTVRSLHSKALPGRGGVRGSRTGSKRASQGGRSSQRRRSSQVSGDTTFSANTSDISWTASDADFDAESIDIVGDGMVSRSRSLQKRMSQRPDARRLTHDANRESSKSFMITASDISDDDDGSTLEFDADEVASGLDDPQEALHKHRMQHHASAARTQGASTQPSAQRWVNHQQQDSSTLGETAEILEEISNLSSQY